MANQERIQNDIETLKTLTAKDRDEGVDASHKRVLLEPKLQTIEADLTSLEASIATLEGQLNAQDSTRSQLAGELGRVKSEITRLETEKQGLERQQRLDRQRLETIDHAVLQINLTHDLDGIARGNRLGRIALGFAWFWSTRSSDRMSANADDSWRIILYVLVLRCL
jgi:chromosome segregation ATPase